MSIDLTTGKPFPRGAVPTPRHELLTACPHVTRPVVRRRPIRVPKARSMFLNNQYGCCVSSEEAAAITMYCAMLGINPEVLIGDASLMSFCRKYGLLDGANLTPVMDLMIRDGMHQDGKTYNDGPYLGVDYGNEAALQSALETGPVKLGMDANALPSGAGNQDGWHASGGRPGQFNNEDHCTGLWNYGPSRELFDALQTPMPSGFPATGYHFYTWSTVGVVDHAWIMSTVGEAWVRNPTTVGLAPTPPDPPAPTPTPDVHPTLDVSLTGMFPTMFGHAPVTITGVAVPRPAPHGVGAGLNPWLLFSDLMAVYAAYQSGSIAAVEAALAKLAADLGLTIPQARTLYESFAPALAGRTP